jgi:uncharacterized cupredoxin-like copper-binding protein
MPDVVGLPAHPLLVHFVVVLVPLAATAFLMVGWRRDWWRRFGLLVILLACAGALAAVLAVESGEALQSPVRRAAADAGITAHFGDHPAYGNFVRVCAVLFAATLLAVWLTDRRRDQSQSWSRAWYAAYSGGVVAALLAIASVTLAGHSGSKLVWRDLGSFAAGRAPTAIPSLVLMPATPGSTMAAPDMPAGALPVALREFRFEPKALHVTAGGDVTLAVANNGKVYHTFTVVELKLDSGVLRPGESKTLSFMAPATPRTYPIICTEEGHDEEGMFGELIID